MPDFLWIDTPDALPGLLTSAAPARVALDTEFVRTDTFYARLGLIQVAVSGQVCLIDATRPAAMDAIKPALAAGEWLLHACAEDIEILELAGFPPPAVIVDTQVAAAFCGFPRQASLQTLLRDVLDVHINKDETRSDWCQRPLSPAQLAYAAQDVAHLEQLWDVLRDRLLAMDRLAWTEEECARVIQRIRHVDPPERAYLQLAEAWQLQDRSLAVLQALVMWRESTARSLDRPRGHIARDPFLFQIAQRLPRSQQALAELPMATPGFVRRHGAVVMGIVHDTAVVEGLEKPPAPLAPEARDTMKALRGVLESVAEGLSLPAELLATRRMLEESVRRALSGDPEWSPSWGQWRRDVLADKIRPVLATMAGRGGRG